MRENSASEWELLNSGNTPHKDNSGGYHLNLLAGAKEVKASASTLLVKR